MTHVAPILAALCAVAYPALIASAATPTGWYTVTKNGRCVPSLTPHEWAQSKTTVTDVSPAGVSGSAWYISIDQGFVFDRDPSRCQSIARVIDMLGYMPWQMDAVMTPGYQFLPHEQEKLIPLGEGR